MRVQLSISSQGSEVELLLKLMQRESNSCSNRSSGTCNIVSAILILIPAHELPSGLLDLWRALGLCKSWCRVDNRALGFRV